VLDFGAERTETYFQSLTHCLELLGDNPEVGSTVDDVRQGDRCFLHERKTPDRSLFGVILVP